MAIGINTMLSMGSGALFANQAAIQTTGNNIANVNTEGYSRQAVRFEARDSLDYYPGQIGQGVTAAEVYRYFDRFIEKSYLDKYSSQSRYEEQNGILMSIQNLFNESSTPGISSLFDQFMKDWSQLAQKPDDMAARAALLANSQNLTKVIQSTDESMAKVQQEIDRLVQANVDEANALIKKIADLNRQIQIHDEPGKNNANSLLDARDKAVRELSQIIDVDIIDSGGGNYVVNTRAGHTLVDGANNFGLAFEGARSENRLLPNSQYAGTVGFSGNDYNEYTLKVTVPQDNSTVPPTPAQFQVSLDGGRSWLQNDDGSTKLFDVTDQNSPVTINNIEVFFTAPGSTLSVGDQFTIMPKSGLYYDHPTKGLQNITPMIYPDGTDNTTRVSGGVITGLLATRDYDIGKYRDKLQAYTRALTWEVNRLHSQGTGMEPLTNALGDYGVRDTNIPLGSDASTLAWKDRLNQLANVVYNPDGTVASTQPGNVTFYIYDQGTGQAITNDSLNFSGLGTPPGGADFDPTIHSLNDVAAAINNTFGASNPAPGAVNYLAATVVDGRLQISSSDSQQYSFGIVNDTSGIMAALGINTFFKGGDQANNIAIRDELGSNPSLVNAGRINGGAEANEGDNVTAKAIAALSTSKVYIKATSERGSNQTLGSYYGGLVATVGANTASASFNAALNRTMANDLADRQDSISGVNLDEEMANLIKFQSSYKAAAKLITTADQMLETILSLKS